ncbi:MAG: HDOD domain-containing protein [Bdellovibrionales bacterium]|nr:HDOD domain-containing protein [Bdellovibrionales bacterium]
MSHALKQPKLGTGAIETASEFTVKTAAEYQELTTKLQDMPTLPVIAMKVNELIADPNATSTDIAAILKQDQVLTAKILRLVNSSYYAVPGGVTDVQKALAFLGFNTVAQLVLSLSVFSMFSKFGDDSLTMKDFWMHALAVAVCSEEIAKRWKIGKPEEAFTCGLLHDIGKLVIYEVDRERLVAILKKTRETKKGFVEVERDLDLLNHAYIGEMMATRWGLPQVVRQAIRYHHTDVSKMASILASAKKTIQVVRLANTVVVKAAGADGGVGAKTYGHSGDYSKGVVVAEMLEDLGLKIDDLTVIEKDLAKAMEKAGAFLNANA